jgi:selenocysteine-specific elongation factor
MTNLCHFILATAGHVDHGKSSLVKALTGIDPDRLPEEKARGITIDLGFAHLTLQAGSPLSRSFQIGIVDVPGHEDFVKNMVAGIGSIDAALLVVAADDGWMPQTEEHFQILGYAGVTRGVVALTKIDLAQAEEASVISSVRARLAGTGFAHAPIVPTSIVSGRGIEELKRALSDVLAQTPAPRDLGKPRLPIDRAFSLPGIGTVVTGTLSGGWFERGQAVIVQPTGTLSRIRSIQSHNQELARVGPGRRTALGLADVSIAAKSVDTAQANAVRRGYTVMLERTGAASRNIDILLERSPRPLLLKGSGRVLKNNERVRVHCGTANAAARLFTLEGQEIGIGQKGIVELRFESPISTAVGDRLVVRDWAEQVTLAGGIVLDHDAQPKRFRTASQKRFLQQRAEAPAQTAVAVQSELERDRTARLPVLLTHSVFSSSEVSAAVETLRATGRILVWKGLLADAAWWNATRSKAVKAIDSHHQAHPEQRGLPLNQLRATLAGDLPSPDVFDTMLEDLCRAGFALSGTDVKRVAHQPALPPALQAPGAKVRSALADKPLDPPSRKELASTPAAQQALRFLVQSGEVVELGPELVLLSTSYARARELIRTYLQQHTSATVSELKQAVGASRRVVVPLLERLDREGVTRRQGDLRTLKS